MRIEIRNESVIIDGYVNAVERDSKVMLDSKGKFIEKIKAGVFQRALDRAKATSYNVKVLLNHDYTRELTNTGDATTKLVEDAIGLRCTCEIRDADVIKKAKCGKLRGWSFGFIALSETRSGEGEVESREIRELELKEVSILDDTKIPAYNGTSIETRSEHLIEERWNEDELETVDNTYSLHEYENRYLMTRI